MKKVTVLGGGTGTYVVLSGLKQHDIDLAAIVTMMDSGGSTGKLRDQLGVLPPGDLRQCLLALSEAPELWRKLFLYRFENGDLEGHNFGNIFLSALEKVATNYDEVLEMASDALQVKGSVLPVTYKHTDICVEYENGNVVKSEGEVDKNYEETARVKHAYLEPRVDPNPKALARIRESDVIIIGPGDLYSSIIPILLVDGVKDALTATTAKLVYISNLFTKSGQTPHYSVSDHVADIIKYLGREPDAVVVNTGEIPQTIVDWYRESGEDLVKNDLQDNKIKGMIIEEDIIDKQVVAHNKADKVDPKVRSILRHDSDKLSAVLLKFIS